MSDNGRSPLTPIDWHVPGPDGRQLVFGAMREDVAHVRPGDEVRIAWREDGVERSCWARVTRLARTDPMWPTLPAIRARVEDLMERSGAPALWVVGRTTLGREVTTHPHWITDVRPELDEGVRQSWAERYGRSGA